MIFRDIFSKSKIPHTTGNKSRKWLKGPNTSYWPQQLNFAVWCATIGCGSSIRSLFDDDMTDHKLNLPKQVRSFLWFHVYFTIRFEIGAIQGPVALLDDSIFEAINNKYDISSYLRICNEFGIHPNSDFRFNKGENRGLGNVYICVSRVGDYKTS